MATPALTPAPGPRRRRTVNFWEPIFDPSEKKPFPEHDWDFEHNAAPKRVTLTQGNFTNIVSKGARPTFDKISFIKCDFQGIFDILPREIVFKNCTFEDCDFGLSTWIGAKFSKCEFRKCSFTQSRWNECDFRNCKWEKIGISGNETEFSSTIITNPGDFIKAAYTNTDTAILEKRNTTAIYQLMRLESTKATVARNIYKMFSDFGDESAYYDALKTSANQSLSARLSESHYNIVTGKPALKLFASTGLIVHGLEWLILNVAGLVNAWGRSVVRPFIIGIAIVALFAIAYAATDCGTAEAAITKAIEVTLLVGYTTYASPLLPPDLHWLVLANVLVGLLWYVVFIPTLVNRISRVR
jgi:hypothetical protein